MPKKDSSVAGSADVPTNAQLRLVATNKTHSIEQGWHVGDLMQVKVSNADGTDATINFRLYCGPPSGLVMFQSEPGSPWSLGDTGAMSFQMSIPPAAVPEGQTIGSVICEATPALGGTGDSFTLPCEP